MFEKPVKTGIIILALAALGTVGPSVVGQENANERSSGATIYRDAGYRGSAVYIGGARSNLRLSWRVKSIRIHSGRWELCERANYQGECRTIDQDSPVVGTVFRGMKVQSIRPVGSSFIGVEANNQILRGRYGEFHTQPEARGFRIPSCPTG